MKFQYYLLDLIVNLFVQYLLVNLFLYLQDQILILQTMMATMTAKDMVEGLRCTERR